MGDEREQEVSKNIMNRHVNKFDTFADALPQPESVIRSGFNAFLSRALLRQMTYERTHAKEQELVLFAAHTPAHASSCFSHHSGGVLLICTGAHAHSGHRGRAETGASRVPTCARRDRDLLQETTVRSF